jgi:hypothetical protein
MRAVLIIRVTFLHAISRQQLLVKFVDLVRFTVRQNLIRLVMHVSVVVHLHRCIINLRVCFFRYLFFSCWCVVGPIMNTWYNILILPVLICARCDAVIDHSVVGNPGPPGLVGSPGATGSSGNVHCNN